MTEESVTMPQPKEIRPGVYTHSLKLPERPGSRVSFILLQTLPAEGLTETNPSKNAELLCHYLHEAVDEEQILAIRDELLRRFPKTRT